MKTYDVVKDAQGTLYMVVKQFWGREHLQPQVHCVRLWDKKYLTFNINELEVWLDYNKESIGK